MLKTKLFQAFAGLVLVFALLSWFVGARIIQNRIVDEAQNQIRLDLGSAWAIYDGKVHEVETVLKLLAIKKAVVDAAADKLWSSEDLLQRLEVIRLTFGFDFLSLTSPDGQVVLRAAQPHHTGDYRLQDPFVSRALKGEAVFGAGVLSHSELQQEGDGLTEKAFLVLEDTPRARPSPKTTEDRGMVIMGAVPIMKGPQLIGAAYGGFLLNRNEGLVDRITDTIFKHEMETGVAKGSATIFLGDCRISTSVRLKNGNRALGTRASKEVADRVLDNGLPWVGPALVVEERYLTAYEPIRDCEGQIIGMLYVGRPERPFREIGRSIMFRYAGLSIFGLAAALLLAFIVAGRLAHPIHQLVEASNRMHRGEPHAPVRARSSCREIENLVAEFNQMAGTLAEREAGLTEANEKLSALNQSYMDMLGFVSHELKSPIASIMNYVFLLRQHKIGPLTEAQEKAVRNIETNSGRILEMVRHYLNLSRIETGELHPVPTRVAVLDDVVKPLIETFESDLASRRIRLENAIEPGVLLHADLNMAREVFENLISNGIKYGREGGLLRLACAGSDGFVEFAVRNEGAGIPADKLETIFGKFTRIEDDQAIRRQKGTGLGLFITRHIVEAHGGRITAASRLGEWAEFRFTLPRFQPEAKK